MSAGDESTPASEYEIYRTMIPSMLMGKQDGERIKQQLFALQQPDKRKQCLSRRNDNNGNNSNNDHYHVHQEESVEGKLTVELFALEPYNIDLLKRR